MKGPSCCCFEGSQLLPVVGICLPRRSQTARRDACQLRALALRWCPWLSSWFEGSQLLLPSRAARMGESIVQGVCSFPMEKSLPGGRSPSVRGDDVGATVAWGMASTGPASLCLQVDVSEKLSFNTSKAYQWCDLLRVCEVVRTVKVWPPTRLCNTFRSLELKQQNVPVCTSCELVYCLQSKPKPFDDPMIKCDMSMFVLEVWN